MEELDNFRRRIDKYRSILGTTENYSFFDDFYLEFMNKLEHKSNILENGGTETAIYEKSFGKFFSLVQKIRFLFKKNENNDTEKIEDK